MVTVFTVATGAYLEFWKQQASSADRHLFPGQALELVVFTDQPAAAHSNGLTLTRARVIPVEVPPLRWPEATLLRYELIAGYTDSLSSEVSMHLDADMLVVRDVGYELNAEGWHSGIALVRHPGYYRGEGSWIASALRSPGSLASDARGFLRGESGIGQWERREESMAYVPPALRTTYVCGATWFGRTPEFASMCRELASRTTVDRERGLIARWHDESHLNWFAAHHDVTVLDPSYCHGHHGRHLGSVEARIIAVDKGKQWSRA